jgi:hypothetical protein
MNFVTPSDTELAALRIDPLVFEQELDVRPDVAESLERAVGFRAGRIYWRAAEDRLYALELGDFGRGRPSMAFIYGFWPRFEPRPATDEVVDRDLTEFCLWLAQACEGLDVADVQQTFDRAWEARSASQQA